MSSVKSIKYVFKSAKQIQHRHKPTNLRTVAASQPLLPNNEAQAAPIRGRMVGGGWGGSPAVTGWMSDVGAGDRDGDTGTPATGIHYTATSHLCSADSEHYIVTNLYTDCLYQRDVSTDKLPTKA